MPLLTKRAILAAHHCLFLFLFFFALCPSLPPFPGTSPQLRDAGLKLMAAVLGTCGASLEQEHSLVEESMTVLQSMQLMEEDPATRRLAQQLHDTLTAST